MPTSIAITGLRTFLGRGLAERLARRGVRVVGIDRLRPHGLPRNVGFREIDLCSPSAGSDLADVLRKEEVEVAVHLAFRREPTPDIDADHELEAIGSLRLLQACAAVKLPRLVVGSTTMAYGPRPDNPNFLSEAHPLRGHPDAHCVANRVEVEAMVADWTPRHPETRTTVLRPCWVIGPTIRDAMVRYFERPVVPVLLGYDPLLQWVHEQDCLDVFERATLEAHPGVFNVVGPGVLPLSVLIRTAGKRVLPVPALWMRRLRNFPSQAQTGDRPAGFYDYLRYLWVADGSKGWAEFGRPTYTTREAWMSFVSARRMAAFE